MKTIKKTKTIAAAKEKVWAVLVEPDFNKIWFSEFMPGTAAEGDWIVNHRIAFKDAQGNGIIGKIMEKQPYDLIHIRYDGIVANGAEDFDSTEAHKVNGAHEIYRLTEENGTTTLHIEVDTDNPSFESMDAAWDRALEKIDELSQAV